MICVVHLYTFIKKMLISKVTLQNQHLYFVLMVISKINIYYSSKTYNLAGSTHLKYETLEELSFFLKPESFSQVISIITRLLRFIR
jgi:hypothetical protein